MMGSRNSTIMTLFRWLPTRDEELFEEMRLALAESVELFSNAHKPDRESWVVSAFLRNMGE
jgi:hypothetical protein